MSKGYVKKGRKESYVDQKVKAKLCEFVKNNVNEMLTTWDDFDGIDKVIEKIVYGNYIELAAANGLQIADKADAFKQFKRWQYGARDRDKPSKNTGGAGPKKSKPKSQADKILLEIDEMMRQLKRRGDPNDMNVSAYFVKTE